MSSLKKLAIKGTIWTFLGYGLNQFLRLISNVILTRLLAPNVFGLMALVNTFRMGLELFSDIGIPQNIIQSDRGDDPVFLDTAWTIQILRGIFIWVCICLVSVPLALFYGEPQLWQVLPVIGFANLFSSFQTVRVYTLNRHIQLGKITLFELCQQIITLLVMVVAATVYPSVWSLVAGSIAGGIFRLIGSYLLCPGPFHKLIMEVQARQEITDFGRWIFLNSIFGFLAEQSDRLILGKLLPLEILGIYSIAIVLSRLPVKIMNQLSFKVIFPSVSKQAHLPRKKLRLKILKQRRLLLFVIYIVVILLAGFGDYIVNFLYDDRYSQAGWMLAVLSLGSWFSVLYYTANPCLMGIGKPSYGAQSRGLRFLIMSIGMLIGFQVAGSVGAIVAVAFSDLPGYLYLSYGLIRESLGMVKQDILLTLGLVLLLILVIVGRLSLGLGHPFLTLFLQ